MFNIYKIEDDRSLNVSYMYHIDDARVEYYNGNSSDPEEIFDNYEYFNRYHESFHLGLNYQYLNSKYEFKHDSYYQISNIKNDIINNEKHLDSKIKWINNFIKYYVSEKYSLYLNNHYKKMSVENVNNENILTENSQYQSSFGINGRYYNYYYYKLGSTLIRKNNEIKKYSDVSVSYINNNYSLKLVRDNSIESSMYDEKLYFFNMQKTSLVLGVNINRFMCEIEGGEMFLEYFNDDPRYFEVSLEEYKKYNYFISEGALKFRSTAGITISPEVKNARYRPYGKISNVITKVNEPYEINVRKDNLFDFDEDNLNLIKEVNMITAELGIVLNSFKISYVLLNPFSDKESNDVHYSPNMLPLLGRYSYIDIVWIFND